MTGGGIARTEDGGFVSLSDAGSFTLDSGTVTGFATSGNGGAISLSGSAHAALAGGTITSCSAQAGGAAYVEAGATFEMSGGAISQCAATGDGGGVYNAGSFVMTGGLIGTEGASPSLSADNALLGVPDFGNTSGGNGGGVYGARESSISVSGSASISGNVAKASIRGIGEDVADYCGGGGICSAGTVEVGGSASISGNVASNGGGIFMVKGSPSLTITSGTFSSNVAFFPGTKGDMSVSSSYNRGNGGCIFTCSSATTISGATFAGNMSTRFGGAIANSDNGGEALSAEGCVITDNTALYREGGGIAFCNTGDNTNTVNNCTISNNYSGKNGGGIFMRRNATIGAGTVISGNACEDNGGGVYVEGGTFTLDGGTIGGSPDAANHAGGLGGGVYASNITQINGGTISYNYASAGGGVYAAARFFIAGGSIDHNFAEGANADGGGVYVANGSAFEMSGGEISNNAANGSIDAGHGNGGGIYLASSPMITITSGVIDGNVAASHGGAIDMGGNAASTVIIGVKNHPGGHACPRITNNKSSLRGGALCIHGNATTYVYCCDITDNVTTNDGTSSSVYQEKGTLNLGSADSSTNAAIIMNGGVQIAGAGVMNVYKDAAVADATLTATGGTVNDYRRGEPTMCTITYKPGYDGSGQSSQTAQVTKDIELTLPTNLFTRVGYRITGWYVEGDASQKPLAQPYKPQGDVTLVALWAEVQQTDRPGTLELRPTCAGAGDRSQDRFTYQIAGTTARGDAVSLYVEAQANATVSVLLNPGSYTITPTAGWEWRYVGAASYRVTIDSNETETLTTPFRLNTTELQSVMTVEEAN